MSGLFDPPFYISILRVFQTQVLRHSLDSNALCMIHENFSQSVEISRNQRRGDLVSSGNKFWRMSELFGRPFCISILKVLQTKILRHSSHLNAFCMIQEYLSQSLEISGNQRVGNLISGRSNFEECLNYLVAPSLFPS